MPKLYNTVTKKFSWHPDSYIGQFPFILEDEAAAQGIVDAEVVVEEVVETPKPKKKKKAAYKSDAVDGDGDRCVLVDERGRVVHGDKLAWLLAVNSGVRSMAVTVMSTSALEPALPGVHVHRTPVGDKHLMRAMAQHGLPLGCEESGHVLFSDGLPGGDGLLTGLRALANDRRPLSDKLAAFKPFPRVKGKVKVNARPPLDALSELQACVEAANARLNGGRVFLRYSGTEPILRVLVEGPDQAVVEEVAAEVTQVAQQVLP